MITSKSYPLIQFWHPLFENVMCNSMSNHQMVDTTILQVCFKLCTLVAFIEKRKCEKFWSSITALELLRFKFKPFFLKHGSICSGYFVLVYLPHSFQTNHQKKMKTTITNQNLMGNSKISSKLVSNQQKYQKHKLNFLKCISLGSV